MVPLQLQTSGVPGWFSTCCLSSLVGFRLSFTRAVTDRSADGATLVFYAALFPRLARNTVRSRELRRKLEDGEVTPEEYAKEESLEKNRISNISTVCCS